MNQTISKPVTKKPDAEKPRAKISHDDKDTIIVLFMPDGRQITFRMRRGNDKAIQV
jgi:hypothetical protein